MLPTELVDLRQRAVSAADAARAQRHRSMLLRMAAQRTWSHSRLVMVRTGNSIRPPAGQDSVPALQARLRASKAAQARTVTRLPADLDRVVANALRLVQQSLAQGDTFLAADALAIVEQVHDATQPPEGCIPRLPGA